MAKPKTIPDTLTKHELLHLGKSATEIAEINEDKMYKTLVWSIHRILYEDTNIVDLTDLVTAIREELKDPDLKEVLRNQRRRYRYAHGKSELRDRAQRAYWAIRKTGRKEIEAMAAKQRILDEPRQRINGSFEGEMRRSVRNRKRKNRTIGG